MQEVILWSLIALGYAVMVWNVWQISPDVDHGVAILWLTVIFPWLMWPVALLLWRRHRAA